jgi:hypothetical protein
LHISPTIYSVIQAGDTRHVVTYLTLDSENYAVIDHYPVINEGLDIAHDYVIDADPEIIDDVLKKTTSAIIRHYANEGVEVEVSFPNQ